MKNIMSNEYIEETNDIAIKKVIAYLLVQKTEQEIKIQHILRLKWLK